MCRNKIHYTEFWIDDSICINSVCKVQSWENYKETNAENIMDAFYALLRIRVEERLAYCVQYTHSPDSSICQFFTL